MGLPAQPGTYALVMASDLETEIRIGSLGSCRVKPGYYAYVGSAFGPGGLAAQGVTASEAGEDAVLAH